nr:unnamed protein product [Digitaria exilis]
MGLLPKLLPEIRLEESATKLPTPDARAATTASFIAGRRASRSSHKARRAQVADEFIKRRAETEWFVEGDFDTYVSQIRKPHVWGGEPELFMASHVLQMPITVYMHDKEAGGLIAIAEYGQEYGTEAPIQVLYHGYGHYEALQIPGKGGPRSRL